MLFDRKGGPHSHASDLHESVPMDRIYRSCEISNPVSWLLTLWHTACSSIGSGHRSVKAFSRFTRASNELDARGSTMTIQVLAMKKPERVDGDALGTYHAVGDTVMIAANNLLRSSCTSTRHVTLPNPHLQVGRSPKMMELSPNSQLTKRFLDTAAHQTPSLVFWESLQNLSHNVASVHDTVSKSPAVSEWLSFPNESKRT